MHVDYSQRSLYKTLHIPKELHLPEKLNTSENKTKHHWVCVIPSVVFHLKKK